MVVNKVRYIKVSDIEIERQDKETGGGKSGW